MNARRFLALPQTSFCARSSMRLTTHAPELRMQCTHAAPPSPRPIALATALASQVLAARPPNLVGTEMLNAPVAASASSAAGWMRRSCSPSLPASTSWGRRSSMRSMTAAISGRMGSDIGMLLVVWRGIVMSGSGAVGGRSSKQLRNTGRPVGRVALAEVPGDANAAARQPSGVQQRDLPACRRGSSGATDRIVRLAPPRRS